MNKTPLKSDITIKNQESLYSGFLKVTRYILDIPRFNGGVMKNVSREVVERNPASAVLLFDPIKEKCVLIEQFRVGAMVAQKETDESPWIYEVVAGLHDKPGESPESSIIREAKEEADCDVIDLIKICEYYIGCGLTSELIHLYIGFIDSTNAGGIFGVADESEDIKVHVYDMDELKQYYYDGKLNNGMTLISVQWLLLNYQQVRAKGKEALAK